MQGKGGICLKLQINTKTTHTHTHTHTHIFNRLSPEFYDNIIRLPIPISNGMLMMIRLLPMHPSPHGFIRSLVVGEWDQGWVMWLIVCLDEMVWSRIWQYGVLGGVDIEMSW